MNKDHTEIRNKDHTDRSILWWMVTCGENPEKIRATVAPNTSVQVII